MFQKRRYLNVLQIIEEGIKQGSLIHGIDHVHFMAMKKVVCNLAVIPFCGVPEKSFTECVLYCSLEAMQDIKHNFACDCVFTPPGRLRTVLQGKLKKCGAKSTC